MKKIYYVVPLLIFVLVFSFALACNGSPTKAEKVEEEPLVIETVPKTINVKYIVLGYNSMVDRLPPEVSVTYSNSQGGTEQISGIELKKLPSELNLLEEWFGGTSYTALRGEVIADYKSFPIDEFMYISAQNQNGFGNTRVCILVDGELWKSSVAKGGYTIATASGCYGE